jgi:hypothetical protein
LALFGSKASGMPYIPVDIRLLILDHVDKVDLPTMCLLNTSWCSFSQDALYRNLRIEFKESHEYTNTKVCHTLARSTHLARRVRSFEIIVHDELDNNSYDELQRIYDGEEIRTSFQNMTYLRSLRLDDCPDLSILDECTFKLSSFGCYYFSRFQPLHQFLLTQSSLTNVALVTYNERPAFGATLLPNLTRATASFSWLQQIIPDRPVNEVISRGRALDGESVDLSFFTLSTAPIQKLTINYSYLYPKPGQLLESIFTSLTHLEINADYADQFNQIVCKSSFLFFI